MYQPLIANYDPNSRKLVNVTSGIFKKLISILIEEMEKNPMVASASGVPSTASTVFISSLSELMVDVYGFHDDLPYSKGRFQFKAKYLENFHNIIRDNFLAHEPLHGSIVFNRTSLTHQHFVLDFDMKHFNCVEEANVISDQAYADYLAKVRGTCIESLLMGRTDNNNNTCNENVSILASYFVYEIIHFITNVLKLDFLPIYVMGKGGTLTKGFHIEIPDLIMPYHDIAVLSQACHDAIPNTCVLDPTINYSCFGSQKNIIENEINGAYLPYAKFDRGQFVFNPNEFKDIQNAFDVFNIGKPINSSQTQIYGFPLFSPISLSNNNNVKLDPSIPKNIEKENESEDKDRAEGNNSVLLTGKFYKLVAYLVLKSNIMKETVNIYKILRLQNNSIILNNIKSFTIPSLIYNDNEINYTSDQNILKSNFNIHICEIPIYYNQRRSINHNNFNFTNYKFPLHFINQNIPAITTNKNKGNL